MPGGTICGIDLGGTNAVAVAIDGSDAVVSRSSRPTGRALLPAMAVDLVADLANELGGPERIDVLGIGIPAPVDLQGRVRSSPILDGWDGTDLAPLVSERCGVRCVADNDVNNAARAEMAERRRAGLLHTDFVFVSVGTGVGGAIVIDGRVWRGVHGGAGEIGHLPTGADDDPCECGGRGCAHVRSSGRSIEHSLGLAEGGLEAAVRAGDAAALGAVARAADHLGYVVASVINLLDLPVVAIGGGVAQTPGFVDRVGESFRAVSMSHVQRCRVEPAIAGRDAGAIGSALLAREWRG